MLWLDHGRPCRRFVFAITCSGHEYNIVYSTAMGLPALSHIWTTRCVQGLFLRDRYLSLDCMHISVYGLLPTCKPKMGMSDSEHVRICDLCQESNPLVLMFCTP